MSKGKSSMALLTAGVAVLLVAFVVANKNLHVKNSSIASTQGVLGATVNATDYIIKVNYANTQALGASKRVSVNVTVQNTSKKDLLLSPLQQSSVRDTTGKTYSYTAKYLVRKTIIGGVLEPSASTTLTLDYDVPAASSVKEFLFQPDGGAKQSVLKI